jgi:hypothetical protein
MAIRSGVLTVRRVRTRRFSTARRRPARHFRRLPAGSWRRVVLVVTDNMGLKKDKDAVAEFWESDAMLTG